MWKVSVEKEYFPILGSAHIAEQMPRIRRIRVDRILVEFSVYRRVPWIKPLIFMMEPEDYRADRAGVMSSLLND